MSQYHGRIRDTYRATLQYMVYLPELGTTDDRVLLHRWLCLKMTGFPPPCMMSGSGVKSSAFGKPAGHYPRSSRTHLRARKRCHLKPCLASSSSRFKSCKSDREFIGNWQKDALRVVTKVYRFLGVSEALDHVAADAFCWFRSISMDEAWLQAAHWGRKNRSVQL